MLLQPKKIPIHVGHKFIAIVNQKMAQMLDVYIADRVILKNITRHRQITAILDITESKTIDNNDIGLYHATWEELHVQRGDRISVTPAPKPESIAYIKKKLDGHVLNTKEIDAIVRDIVNDDLSDIEMAYFTAAALIHQMTDEETIQLTRSIVKHGNKIQFKKGEIVADKHCTGGVPGNRTTMLVVPIMAAAGIKMPKTSSRAITSPAGTADTMEVLANVKNDAKKLKKIVEDVGAFITWGGGVDLAAADDKMIRVRFSLSLDPKGLLLSSIMAKKYAVGANHVLIDIPMGPDIKIKTKKQAEELKKDFQHIGKLLKMKISVMVSDGSQPIGNGIGPVLEAIDVLKVLNNDPTAPKDLRKKSLKMAAILLELTKKAKKGEGHNFAEKILASGKALQKMNEIIAAQGAKKKKLTPAEFEYEVKSEESGKITHINNKEIVHISRIAGAPKDPAAGLYLFKKVGDKVKKGETLYRIYTGSKNNFAELKKELQKNNGYTITKT